MRVQNTADRNTACNTFVDRVDTGASPVTAQGYANIYDDSSKTTLLAEIPLNNPAYHAAGAQGDLGAGSQPATVGRAWLDCNTAEPEDSTPAASGTAAYCEIIDRDGNAVFDGTVGTTGSSEFVELNSLSIQTTVPIKLTNGSITVAQGSL